MNKNNSTNPGNLPNSNTLCIIHTKLGVLADAYYNGSEWMVYFDKQNFNIGGFVPIDKILIDDKVSVWEYNLNPDTDLLRMMREPTEEERESVRRYVESISKKSGVNFYDLIDSNSDSEEDDNYGEYQNEYDEGIRSALIVMLRRLYETAFNLLSPEDWNMFKKEAYSISYSRQFDEKETDESSINIPETEPNKEEVKNSKYDLDPDMPCNKKKCDTETRQSCCGCPEQLEYERKLKQQNKK